MFSFFDIKDITHLAKKHLVLTMFVVVVVVCISAFFLVKQFRGPLYDVVMVKTGNIVEEISASGKVESPAPVDLRFKNYGTLSALAVQTGEKVGAGALLAEQDVRTVDAEIRGREAAIAVARAELNRLLAGVSDEEIAIARTEAAGAKTAFVDVLRDAYTKADDAVKNKADQFFDNPLTAGPSLNIASFGRSDIEKSRAEINDRLLVWKRDLDVLISKEQFAEARTRSEEELLFIKAFLDDLSSLVNRQVISSALTQTTFDAQKAAIAAARGNIDTALSNLTTSDSARIVAEQTLESKLSPARPSDILVHESQIEQAQAALDRSYTNRTETTLTAPIAGVVTRVDGEVGELVGPDRVVISLMPENALQVSLHVSENNIINVAEGQTARITLDAFSGTEWKGVVTHIDPAETIIGGAVYYKTTILFDNGDDRIRSGMTADVWVHTAFADNALIVPASAVYTKDGHTVVEVLDGRKLVEREVVTGLSGNNGQIQIVSGLSAGEQVAVGGIVK